MTKTPELQGTPSLDPMPLYAHSTWSLILHFEKRSRRLHLICKSGGDADFSSAPNICAYCATAPERWARECLPPPPPPSQTASGTPPVFSFTCSFHIICLFTYIFMSIFNPIPSFIHILSAYQSLLSHLLS